MIQIVTVDGREIVKASGLQIDMPVFAKIVLEDDTPLGCFGLAWGGGRCWAWLQVENYRPGYAFLVRREGRKCLRSAVQLGETEVYTPRDTQYASSEKLLKILGFEFFAMEGEQEIWRWQDSKQ
ncbi:hypothetical protein [Brucella sp. IR073]|uniref:hypothetical protein n=1 Tax=unclassified Brucella TaxID=2632610 RepID=UPI003B97D4D7